MAGEAPSHPSNGEKRGPGQSGGAQPAWQRLPRALRVRSEEQG